MNGKKLLYYLLFPASMGVLLVDIHNAYKTLILLILWLIFFFPLTKKEIILFFTVNGLLSIGNYGALDQGVFVFSNPDYFGFPLWEPFMWGFYWLLTYRIYPPEVNISFDKKLIPLIILFASSFSISPSHVLILSFSAFFLIVAFCHSKMDLIYAGHMIAIGTLWEYVGVQFNLFYYPQAYLGGVAYWYVSLWGGMGILFYRVLTPILLDSESVEN